MRSEFEANFTLDPISTPSWVKPSTSGRTHAVRRPKLMWTWYLIVKCIVLAALLVLFPADAPPLLGWGVLVGALCIPLVAWLESMLD